MKNIVIYHGSTNIIKCPQLSLGKKNNDYGQGFYCTEDLELAKEWACKFQNDGYANKYELNVSGLKILKINELKDYVLRWITILLENRLFDKTPEQEKVADFLIDKYKTGLSKYDVIIGYRADDSYFSYAEKFLENSLSLENLINVLKFGSLGEQIVLVSEKAFKNLKFVGYEKADYIVYNAKFIDRDRKAREEYNQLIRNCDFTDGAFAIDIIRKRNKYL